MLQTLIGLLAAWCARQGVTPASADALLADEWNGQRRAPQIDWLRAYIALWDQSIDLMEGDE